MLADALKIDAERALKLFYSTEVYKQLSDSKYGLQLMSDKYILEDIAKRFNIKIDELCRAYTKGAIDGFKEQPKE